MGTISCVLGFVCIIEFNQEHFLLYQWQSWDGKEQALAEIGNPDGTFAGGGINIWAESADGTLLADPTRKEEVGKNLLEASDAYGEKTTLTGISTLRNGTGFVHAMIPGRTGGSERPVPALVYRKKVDDTWWICGSLPGIEIR